MWLAVLVPIIATALGTLLALGARRWHWVFEPVRSFALAAVTITIAIHLMPEAIDAVGPWALLPLAAGLVLPTALGWIGERLRGRGGGGDHAAVAVELTYVGVLAHQVGDGLALGAIAGPAHAGHTHWDLLIAIGAHTVPLAAVVAITFAARDGRRAAIGRAVVVAITPLIGIAIARLGDLATTDGASPWLNAAVSGLLLHVLAHDLPSAETRTPGMRTAELVAVGAGIALPLLFSGHDDHHGDHHGLAERIPEVLRDLALAAAPALLAGILLGALLSAAARRAQVRWLAGGRGVAAGLRGAVLAVPLPPCSCDIVPVARELRGRGGGGAFLASFVLASPQLGLGALLITVALLGWQLALIRLVGAIGAAILAGLLVERLSGDRGAAVPGPLPSGPRSLLDGVDDLVAHDGAWIVVGLTIAAFIAGAAPAGTLGGPLDLVVVAIGAVVITVSATAATPIAAALVGIGLSPGVAVAGLLLGSTLNLTTIGFLRATWGGRAAAAAIAMVLAVAVAIAIAVDRAGIGAVGLGLGDGVGRWIAAIALAVLAAASLWRHGLAHWLAALRGTDHGHDHGPRTGADHCDHHHEPHAH